jgi:hypothetical protein
MCKGLGESDSLQFLPTAKAGGFLWRFSMTDRAIWKYTLEVTDLQTLEMPVGAEILSVQMQHGVPTLWATVNPAALTQFRTIAIHGTGNPIPGDPGIFLGTVQQQVGNSTLVWHIFSLDSR